MGGGQITSAGGSGGGRGPNGGANGDMDSQIVAGKRDQNLENRNVLLLWKFKFNLFTFLSKYATFFLHTMGFYHCEACSQG